MKTPPQGAVDALILAQTRELHLPTVGARYGELADEAAREGTPHRDYLAHLFEMELDDRGQRRPNPTSCAPNGALITKLSVLRISPG